MLNSKVKEAGSSYRKSGWRRNREYWKLHLAEILVID